MSLGENLRVLRKNRGWTQQELATKTGIKLAHISTLESQESDPKLSTIYKLIDALACTPNELLADQKRDGGESTFRAYLENAEALPTRDKLILTEIIRRFISADYARLAHMVNMPDDALEWMVRDDHIREQEEQGKTPNLDQEEIEKDVRKIREIRDQNGY